MLYQQVNASRLSVREIMTEIKTFVFICNLTCREIQLPMLSVFENRADLGSEDRNHCLKLHLQMKTYTNQSKQRGFIVDTHEWSHNLSAFFLLSGPIIICLRLRDESHPLIF